MSIGNGNIRLPSGRWIGGGGGKSGDENRKFEGATSCGWFEEGGCVKLASIGGGRGVGHCGDRGRTELCKSLTEGVLWNGASDDIRSSMLLSDVVLWKDGSGVAATGWVGIVRTWFVSGAVGEGARANDIGLSDVASSTNCRRCFPTQKNNNNNMNHCKNTRRHHNGDQAARQPYMMCSIFNLWSPICDTLGFGYMGAGDGLI